MNELIPPKPHRGKAFRELRHRKSLSLQSLGDAIGVDPSTISRWESRRDFHQFARFVQALHKLGTTPEAFFELTAPDQLEVLPAAQAEPELAHTGYTNRLENWGM
jgi:transcriptional regulator with XRE-family HTH domain